MPKFTLIKHPDNQFDAEVTVTFESDMLGVARGHFDDFLQASGFELPLETKPEKESSEIELDDLWNKAFAYKFAGADIISFPTNDDEAPF